MKKNESKDKDVSFLRKCTFGMSGMADNLMQNSIMTVASPVMVISLGMNPALLGVAVFISRIWDAFTDPLMGSISDNTRTRFGRRRPYMLVGGVLAGLVLIGFWQIPAGMSDTANFIWFLGGLILFYTCYTVFNVPCNALGYELSSNYNERTRIMALRSIFASASSFAIHWQYKMTQLDRFEDTLDGIHTVAIFVGVLIIATTAIPAIFSRERLAETVAASQEKIPFFSSTKTTFRNRNFVLLMGAIVATCLGLFMVSSLGTFINIYYVCGGSEKEGATIMALGGTIYGLAGLLTVPLLTFVSGRIGKKKTLIWGLSLAFLGVLLKWFTYTPEHPYLQFITLAFMAPSLQALWMLTPSIVADICDEDELATGVRREGMYSAVYGYLMKIGMSIAYLVTGFLLNATGFDAELGGNQTESAIFWLRFLFVLVPGIGLFVALVLVSRLTTSQERAEEVKYLLEKRHAEAAAS